MHSKQPLTYAAVWLEEPHESHPGNAIQHTSLSSVSYNAGADTSLGKAEGQDDTPREGEWRQRRRHFGNPPKATRPTALHGLVCRKCGMHTLYAIQTGSCDMGSTCCISMCCKACAISAFAADASAAESNLHIPCRQQLPAMTHDQGHSYGPSLNAFIAVLCPFLTKIQNH